MMKSDSRKLQTCMNPFTSNVLAVDHADEGQAFFCLGDQINIQEYFQG